MPDDSIDLRDYLEQRIKAERERSDAKHAELVAMLMALKDAREKLTEAHSVAHAREHEATDLALIKAHDSTKEAIKVGRDAASQLADVHAAAHEREHVAHRHEHDMSEDALKKAATHIDQRLAAMNEFREQLRDQAATFVRRELMDAEIKSVISRFDGLAKSNAERIAALERKEANLTGRLTAMGIGVALVVIVINIILRFI